MRIERLWGISPPTPVWPGSPQTALIFVGLPLLTALVLLATPLHDAGPPSLREEAAVPAGADVPAPEPRVAAGEHGQAALPRIVARRQRVADESAVPAVIYETPRSRQRARPPAMGGAPAVVPTITSLPSAPEMRLARVAVGADAPQSP